MVNLLVFRYSFLYYFKYLDLPSMRGHFLYLHNDVTSKKFMINKIKTDRDETTYIFVLYHDINIP